MGKSSQTKEDWKETGRNTDPHPSTFLCTIKKRSHVDLSYSSREEQEFLKTNKFVIG